MTAASTFDNVTTVSSGSDASGGVPAAATNTPDPEPTAAAALNGDEQSDLGPVA